MQVDKNLINFKFFKKYKIEIVCLLFTSMLLYYAIYCKIGYTFDSLQYTAAAQSFARDFSLKMYDGSVYTPYTPLLPWVYALFPFHPGHTAVYLHISCLLASLAIWFWLGKQLFHNRKVYWMYLLALVFGTPLYLIHSFLWSEPLFLVFLSVNAWALYQYTRKPLIRYVWLLMLMGVLLCLQRNAGGLFVWAYTLVWLAYAPSHRKIKDTLLIFLLPTLVWTAWTIRNRYMGFDYLFVETDHFVWDILHNIHEFLDGIGRWFLPQNWNSRMRIGFSLCLFAVLLRGHFKHSHQLKNKAFIACLFWVNLLYFMAIHLIGRDVVYFSDVERILAILYPGCFLLIFIELDAWLLHISERKHKIITQIFILIWLLFPIGRTLKNIDFWHHNNCDIISTNILPDMSD